MSESLPVVQRTDSWDACSVANLATLSLDLVTFQTLLVTFPFKATSDKSSDFLDKLKRVSVIVGSTAMVRDQCTRISFSASALFSEHLRGAAVQLKEILLRSWVY